MLIDVIQRFHIPTDSLIRRWRRSANSNLVLLSGASNWNKKAVLSQELYRRFLDNHFPGQTFPGQDVSRASCTNELPVIYAAGKVTGKHVTYR